MATFDVVLKMARRCRLLRVAAPGQSATTSICGTLNQSLTCALARALAIELGDNGEPRPSHTVHRQSNDQNVSAHLPASRLSMLAKSFFSFSFTCFRCS